MEKNTVIAIVLCSVIVIASLTLQTVLFGNNVQEETAQATESVEQNVVPQTNSAPLVEFAAVTETEQNVQEQTVVIETPEIRATLSNRGGDIIGYELIAHRDTDTGRGVEMADNISQFNRACALTIGGTDGTLINELFNVSRPDSNTVLFTKTIGVPNGDGSVSQYILGKRYTFMPGEYLFKLEILLHGENGAIPLNKNGVAYTIRTSPQIGPHYDSANRYEYRQFLAYNGQKIKRTNVGTNQFKQYDKETTWGGIAGKYFEELIVPESPSAINSFYYSSRVEVDNYANAQAFLLRNALTSSDVNDTYYVYFGPREERVLMRYNSAENNGWNLSTLKLNDSLASSGWLSWLERILKWIMEKLYLLIPNWGVSIILMTVLLKLVMFPLTKQQLEGTSKMQTIQPKMQELQAKYKDNPQKQQEELQKLYKQAGYNPMSGCLPMLFQFLIIFAMFNLFNNYFEFRGASFIPGWIPDLSAGDNVYTFSRSIPFIGNQLHVLPIIYLISQLLFGKITQMGGTAAGQSATQMKIMMYGMPIMFFFIFYQASSGLLIYWTVSNVLQLIQQIITNKMMKNKKAVAAPQKKVTAKQTTKKK